MGDSKFDKQLSEMMEKSGAELVRTRKHAIYRLLNGQVIPMSQTPSDWRASRKRITVLKHALAKATPIGEKLQIEPVLLPDRPRRKKMATPNWETHGEPGQIQLPQIESARPLLPDGATYTSFGSLWEIKQALADMDDFWALGPAGRIRVLIKTLPRSMKVEPVPLQFCRATIAERDNLFTGDCDTDLMFQLLDRMKYTCDGGWYVGLLVSDPEEGDMLVEAASLSVISDTWEDIQIIDVDPGETEGCMLANRPLWNAYADDNDDPEEAVLLFALAPKLAHRQNIHFMTDEAWSNPSAIRHVVEALQQRDNPDYVPRPRPVITPALTPYQQTKKWLSPEFKQEIAQALVSVDDWVKETDWLVAQLKLDPTQPAKNSEKLDWVGRLLGFALENNILILTRELNNDFEVDEIELWFSFLTQEEKDQFHKFVRDDLRHPRMKFRPPKQLECLPLLQHPSQVFDSDDYARIVSSGRLREKFKTNSYNRRVDADLVLRLISE